MRPTPLVAFPSLDQLADDPGGAFRLPREARAALLARCAAVQTALAAAALAEAPAADPQAPAAIAGRLLTVEQTAARLGISKHSVYANADEWPFTVRVGRSLRFHEGRLAAWVERRATPRATNISRPHRPASAPDPADSSCASVRLDV